MRLICALFCVLSIGVTSTFAAEPATTPAAAPATEHLAAPAEAAKSPAETIVQNVCAACHAADGNSVVSVNPKLAGQHPEYLIKQLTEFKSGKRANAVMSAMAANLSPEDMKGLAAYFSAQKISLAKAKSNGHGSLGEKIYRGGIAATGVPACASCHGATGSGLPKQFPRMAAQHSDYLLAQLRTFRTGERANAPMMMAIAAKMTDAEMAAVSDYMQGLR